MALTVVALLGALSVNAGAIASRSVRSSLERSQAAAEAEIRLASAWPRLRAPGAATGPADVFGGPWRLEARVRAGEAGSGPALCDVVVAVTPLGARRTYRLETSDFCIAAGNRA